MTCSDCIKASVNVPYRQCNPSCLWCGVRMLQLIGKLNISNADCSRLRRAELAVWLSHGHNEAVIRSLVPGPLCLGPVKTVASAGQPRSKPLSAGPKS